MHLTMSIMTNKRLIQCTLSLGSASRNQFNRILNRNLRTSISTLQSSGYCTVQRNETIENTNSTDEILDTNKTPSKFGTSRQRMALRQLLSSTRAGTAAFHNVRKYLNNFQLDKYIWGTNDTVLIASAMIQNNDPKGAVEFIKSQTGNRSLSRLNFLCSEAATLGNAYVALAMIDIIRLMGYLPDVITYTSAIHACARDNIDYVPHAIVLFHAMKIEGLVPNDRTYSALVLAYCRLNKFYEVQLLMKELYNAYSNDKTFIMDFLAKSIITCVRSKEYLAAIDVYNYHMELREELNYPEQYREDQVIDEQYDKNIEDDEQNEEKKEGIEHYNDDCDALFPGIKACNSVLLACAQTRDAENFERIYSFIEKYELQDVYTCNAIMTFHTNARNFDMAMSLFDSMKENEFGPLIPDIVTYNELLRCAGKRTQNADKIPSILEEMEKDNVTWDAKTLNILLASCVLEGDVQRAKLYWETAEKINAQSKTKRTPVIVNLDRTNFEALMEVYLEGGAYNEVIDLWINNELCNRRTKSRKALNILIRACTKTVEHAHDLHDDVSVDEKILMGERIVKEFSDRGLPIMSISHNHMLELYLAGGRLQQAYEYLLVTMMHSDIGILATTYSFTLLMKYIVDRSPDLLSTDDVGNNPQQENPEQALYLFQLFWDIARKTNAASHPRLHFRKDALYILGMKAALKCGPGKHNTLQKIYQIGVADRISNTVRWELLSLLLQSCEKASDWKCAVTMYANMWSKDFIEEEKNQSLYAQVLRIVAMCGKYEQALEIENGDWYRQNRFDQGW